ncbi:MAG: redoxin domain-containing protein [Candidatus Longimicrobiales bacterium M2_2A_002]
MRRLLRAPAVALVAAALALAGTEPAVAQDQDGPIEIGAEAPDFTLPGATRHGVLVEPVSLSDYEGETVVLAFFFRARTKG